MNFNTAVEIILSNEGGYVDDPKDPGGETRYGISKRCLDADARILTSDLNWIRAGDLTIDHKLLAFDEVPEKHGKLNLRRFREATVEDIGPVNLPASIIKTDKREILCSDDHQWLRRWGAHRVFDWCKTSDLLKPKGKWTNGVRVLIGSAFEPWEQINSREAGYLGGILDGEGHISGSTLGFTQKDNKCSEQAIRCAESLGLKFIKTNRQDGVHDYRYISDGPYGALKVIGSLGAERLKKNAASQVIGRSIASTKAKHEVVVSVTPVGNRDLIGISTSTKTLICEGLLSHNSYPNLDIKNLSRDQAKKIYKDDYWNKVRGDKLPLGVAIVLFDMAVNMGIKRAVMILQKVCGVKRDGIIGDATISAANNLTKSFLIEQLTAERILFYTTLDGWPRFGRGWTIRSVETMSTSLLIRDTL